MSTLNLKFDVYEARKIYSVPIYIYIYIYISFMSYQTVESGRWLATQPCNIFSHLPEYTLPVRKTLI